MVDLIQIDSTNFYQRLLKIYSIWNQKDKIPSVNSIFVINGKNTNQTYTLASLVHFWLIEYEFTETLIIILPNECIILTSAKKVEILSGMQQPAQYAGPKLTLVKRDPKIANKEQLDGILKGIPTELLEKVGTFTEDKLEGEFADDCKAIISSKQVDIALPIKQLISIKSAQELDSIRKAAKVEKFLFLKLISEVENILDNDEKVTHKGLSEKIAQFADSTEANTYYKDNSIDKSLVTVSSVPSIQSGGNYQVSMVDDPNESNISADVILLGCVLKYSNYSCAATRTLLIDADDVQKKNYTILHDAFIQALGMVVVGTKICDMYNAAINSIKSADPSLLEHISPNLGSGIGIALSEDCIEINGKNESKIEQGMVIHLKIYFDKLVSKKGKNYCLMLSDTVIVKEDKREVITSAIPKAQKDISYAFEDESKDNKKTSKDSKKPIIEKADIINQPRQLRGQVNKDALEKATKRKDHQRQLQNKKLQDLKDRYSQNKIKADEKNDKKTNLQDLKSYNSSNDYPKEIKKNIINCDIKAESIIVPIHGRMVPFHVSTIKNVSQQIEAEYCYLRINFHVPGVNINTNIELPDLTEKNSAYIKELSFRSSDIKNVMNTYRIIKEMSKKVKAKEQEEKDKEDLVTQEPLIQIKGKKPLLNDICIRPNLSGKKTQGILEAHQNGIRFTSKKGEKIDVIYRNIKHAFFQPCENELITLVHFNLHNPIMIGKKKSKDVQFYAEGGSQVDDIDLKRRNANDYEELEQEQRERAAIAKMNDEFKKWVEAVEGLTNNTIEFDVPYRDLGFLGAPGRANVLLLPTVNCLVNLTEIPFFVVALDDIEVVVFEGVHFSLKNLDIVLVMKDLTNFVRIRTVPAENLEGIKDWLDQVDLLFYESSISLNWPNVLLEIRENPQKFIEEDKGWSFLQEESEEEVEPVETSEDDPDFKMEELKSNASSESECSESLVSESSSFEPAEEEEDDEEGESWEEMERKAEWQDKEYAKKHPPVEGVKKIKGKKEKNE